MDARRWWCMAQWRPCRSGTHQGISVVDCTSSRGGEQRFRRPIRRCFAFPEKRAARIILGRYGDVASEVRAPGGVNYLDVALKKGEKWRYEPPSGHTVAWAAVHEGELAAPAIGVGELAVFEESNGAIEFEAIEQTGFIIGSAVKHPYNLVLGAYSVHMSRDSLEKGEARIAAIRRRRSS